MKIYFDFNDWWIGYYKGSNYHFICPLPTLVIRWDRKSWKQNKVFEQTERAKILASSETPDLSDFSPETFRRIAKIYPPYHSFWQTEVGRKVFKASSSFEDSCQDKYAINPNSDYWQTIIGKELRSKLYELGYIPDHPKIKYDKGTAEFLSENDPQ